MKEISIGILIAIFTSLFIHFINLLIGSIDKKEFKDIKNETEEIVNSIQNKTDYDVFKLLYKNVRESTEYYIISKKQTNKSFMLAIISCIFGVMIYVGGFIVVSFFDKNIIILSTISGTVVEVLSGLSFSLYIKCIKQLREYHKSLRSTEKYLTSIQMADKMSETGREEIYEWLIKNVMRADLYQYQFTEEKNDDK